MEDDMVDGLDDWTRRRHGAGHPNQPRQLTKVRLRRIPGEGAWLEGDHGTSRWFAYGVVPLPGLAPFMIDSKWYPADLLDRFILDAVA